MFSLVSLCLKCSQSASMVIVYYNNKHIIDCNLIQWDTVNKNYVPLAKTYSVKKETLLTIM